jgi:cytosine/adenosine deaminase-related metal-dependent hydrolase
MTLHRRAFMQALSSVPAASLLSACGTAGTQALVQSRPRKLIKGAYVVSLDPGVGEMAQADVLVDGPVIAAIGRKLEVADAEVIDGTRKMVLPGLIDTHRHTWQSLLRSMIAESNFTIYQQVITGTLAPLYRPEDIYIGNLLGAVGAMNSGITTLLDWSHALQSPAHADAAIQGLVESGIRSVFAHGDPSRSVMEKLAPGGKWRQPEDLRRIQKQYFSTDDQRMTLAMALRGPESASMEVSLADIRLARELGIRMTMHVGVLQLAKVRAITRLNEAKVLGPDITHVHTLSCTDAELQMIADTGGTISTSSATEMNSGHGFPSIQRWLRYGLRPSFSVDNETRMPTDLFTQMRALVISDHLLEAQRVERDGGSPVFVPMRDVLGFATLEGARATGLDRKIGTLAPGKRADLIMIDLSGPTMAPVFDPVATAVMLAQASDVSLVMVDGVVKKRDGQLLGVDLARINRLAAASHEYLMRAGNLQPKM